MINDIRQLLLGEATVNALVGSNVFVTRPNKGSTMPRIVLHQMGSEECGTSEGTSAGRIVELDIDCEGDTAAQAFTLATAVRLFIQDFKGPTVSGGITVAAIYLDDEHEKKPEKTTQPGQTVQFSVTLPISVLY